MPRCLGLGQQEGVGRYGGPSARNAESVLPNSISVRHLQVAVALGLYLDSQGVYEVAECFQAECYDRADSDSDRSYCQRFAQPNSLRSNYDLLTAVPARNDCTWRPHAKV